jgi:hypothetical protein
MDDDVAAALDDLQKRLQAASNVIRLLGLSSTTNGRRLWPLSKKRSRHCSSSIRTSRRSLKRFGASSGKSPSHDRRDRRARRRRVMAPQ